MSRKRAQRVVVVGADATGMSAAHQAIRAARTAGRELDVVALEATQHTSYSACGIPYWLAGDVDSGDDLVARSAAEHRDAGIDLRLGTRVTAVDVGARTVAATGPEGELALEYDDLVLATGARAAVPDWARDGSGALLGGVAPVKNLDDGGRWQELLAGQPGEPVVIVGGGYIGIEMAEALLRREHPVTLVTRSRLMSGLEPALSERVTEALRSAGAEVVEGASVQGLVGEDQVKAVVSDAGEHPAGLVVVALGVEPVTELLEGQLPDRLVGPTGGLRPDGHGYVMPGLWSAGDCCEVWHRLRDDWAFLPLGTHANKHGRALGDQLGSGGRSRLRFDGALGTAITRFAAPTSAGGSAYVEVALTGLGHKDAPESAVSVVTEGRTASGYLAEAEPILINVTADPATRRLLGVQIVGGHGAGKRIDTAAAVLWARGSVDDLAWMDLSYAPPFATAWEILQIAARRLAERI